MAVYDQAPQTSAVYTITNAQNYIAVLNDTVSSNYVGAPAGEEGITGLDSAEIRQNLQRLVEGHGAVQGNNWLGERPITMRIEVLGSSVADRNAKLERLKRATHAFTQDATISWTNTGSIQQQVKVRRTGFRITGAGMLKTVFVSFVASDPRIYSAQLYTTTIAHATNGSVENQGDFEMLPIIRINGPTTGTANNPKVLVGSAGQLVLGNAIDPAANGGAAFSLTVGQYVDIDMNRRTVIKQDGSNVYSAVDFKNTVWSGLLPGTNLLRLDYASGTTTGATVEPSWRDAWA